MRILNDEEQNYWESLEVIQLRKDVENDIQFIENNKSCLEIYKSLYEYYKNKGIDSFNEHILYIDHLIRGMMANVVFNFDDSISIIKDTFVEFLNVYSSYGFVFMPTAEINEISSKISSMDDDLFTIFLEYTWINSRKIKLTDTSIKSQANGIRILQKCREVIEKGLIDEDFSTNHLLFIAGKSFYKAVAPNAIFAINYCKNPHVDYFQVHIYAEGITEGYANAEDFKAAHPSWTFEE